MSDPTPNPTPPASPKDHQPEVNQPVLKREDVHTGLSVVQSIYAIAIVLGFKNALEVSYDLFLSPLSAPSGALPHWVVLSTLGSIMLLGLRFFWVPRNLYAYVLASPLTLKKRLQRMTVLHVPITLIHALLFFCVCEAYADLASSNVSSASTLAEDLTTRVVAFYAALLLLNSGWLLSIGSRGSSKAEGIWGWNNLVCGSAVVIILLLFKASALPTITFTLLAVAVFVINGVLDLWLASEYYILFPESDSEKEKTRQANPA